MKRQISCRPPQSSRAEPGVFAGLGLVALLLVVLSAAAMSDFVPGKEQVPPGTSGTSPAHAKGLTALRYISSGMWLADIKTLAAVARWVIEPEGTMTSVGSPVGQPSGLGSFTHTNSSSAGPNA